MITAKLINDSVFDTLTRRWIQTFSGRRYFYIYDGSPEQYRQFESCGRFGTGQIHEKRHFALQAYMNYETVEDAALCAELEEDRLSAERWQRIDRMEYFRENLVLLLTHAEAVLSDPPMYWSQPGVTLSGTSFSGGVEVPVGTLLDAWRSGQFIRLCPNCRKRSLYIFRITAGLSGGFEHGLCTSCGKAAQLDGPVLPGVRALFQRVKRAMSEEQEGLRFNAVVELLKKNPSE